MHGTCASLCCFPTCDRGGKNNQHSGNEKLRMLARGESANYRVSTKKGKSAISRDIVQKMRDLKPPARFLKRDTDSGEWEDVGDDIAREKASQVLRDAVALLPEEQGGEIVTEDIEPLPASDVDVTAQSLTASVTHDEMDRKHSERRITPSISTTPSFPPASPIEDSRKRPRHYYYPPQYPHGYASHPPQHHQHPPYPPHHRYEPNPPPHRGFDMPPPDPYPRYPQHHPDDPNYSVDRSGERYHPYHYHAGPPLPRSSSSDMNPPPPRPDYAAPIPQQQHSYRKPEQQHQTPADGAFFPPAPAHSPSRPPPRTLRADPASSSPLGSQLPHPGGPYQQPYHDSPARYTPSSYYPHSQRYHPLQSSPGVMRRPRPLSETFRQDSSATQQSSRSMYAESSVGTNDFDLFQGDLLDSDHEHSPRRQRPYRDYQQSRTPPRDPSHGDASSPNRDRRV
uniref:DUF6824 domain-containing protein n=1 Tax=Entomoneis paludosa TaxID=265537 RepID=A0A7S3DZ12_9STRA|mmetsp:Transcript_9860/g.20393  ORF Transcript_9860/g.20393 Transcript_9860/m.20393 type:complete len:452 (+) Transcript_9860:89-1444(+)